MDILLESAIDRVEAWRNLRPILRATFVFTLTVLGLLITYAKWRAVIIRQKELFEALIHDVVH